jgi:hypothetical protein
MRLFQVSQSTKTKRLSSRILVDGKHNRESGDDEFINNIAYNLS